MELLRMDPGPSVLVIRGVNQQMENSFFKQVNKTILGEEGREKYDEQIYLFVPLSHDL